MVKIHFLNVGHGDCTIIEHASGRITMIDINQSSDWDPDTDRELMEAFPEQKNDLIKSGGIAAFLRQPAPAPAGGFGIFPDRASGAPRTILEEIFAAQPPQPQGFGILDFLKSRRELFESRGYRIGLTDPVAYYQQHFRGRPIFRYIQTHPDLDHMRGLHRLAEAGINILHFWDTDHRKEIDDFQREHDEESWNEYLRHRAGRDGTKRMVLHRGANDRYYAKGDDTGDAGDGLFIMAPTVGLVQHANDREDWNSHSYVLYFEYAQRAVIFGGDATPKVWKDIHDTYGDGISCLVLKAAHHGRDSGYYQPAVAAMKPELTVVSVGKKPETDATNKYKRYCPNVISTRWCGNIVVTIQPDGSARFDTEHVRL